MVIYDEIKTTPRILTETPQKKKRGFGRRKFVVGAVAAIIGAEPAVNVVEEGLFLLYANGVKDKVEAFLKDKPTEQQMLEGMYGIHSPIELTPEQGQHVTVRVFGDSMNLSKGKRIDRLGTTQPDSTGQILADTVKQQLGLDWTCLNYAVPGAPTDQGPFGEGLMGNRQLGSPTDKDFPTRKDIATDPNHQIIIIGLNGDNWRPIADQLKHLLTDIHALKNKDNPQNAPIFDNLLKQFDSIGNDFNRDIGIVLSMMTEVNKARKANNLDNIDLVFTLPMNYRKVDKLPWAELKQDAKPSVMDIKKFANGNKELEEDLRTAVGHITSTIYEKIKGNLARFTSRRPLPFPITTISMFGLEQSQYIDDETAHLNPDGEKAVAQRILSRIRILQPTLDRNLPH